VTGCSKSEGDRTAKEQDFINTAINEARKFNYPVENMDIKLKREGNEILVYFSPKHTNEANMKLGGDLTVYIDSNNGKVVKVERGQ
jgi:hypothetical protein